MAKRITPTKARHFLELLNQAASVVAREHAQRLATIGYTAAQAAVLRILMDAGTLSLNELSEQLLTDAPPSRLVQVLVDRGLVTRQDQSNDRRRVELTLTKEGKKAMTAIRRIDRAMDRWAAKQLGTTPVASGGKALTALLSCDI